MSNVRQRRPLRDDAVARGIIAAEKEHTESNRHLFISWFCYSFAALVGLFVVAAFLLPAPIDPEYYEFSDPPALTGPLSINDDLLKADRLFENQIFGPESMVKDGDHLYAGTADGKIVDIYKGELRTLAKLGQDPCGGFDDEPTCGRPLGMRLDKDGYLIVVDAYLGLFKVNVATGGTHLLLPSSLKVEGRHLVFMNDLDISEDGIMYISQTSTKWERRHNRYCILELETTGRILRYDPKKNITTVLVDGLSFPNGIQISRNKEYFLVIETSKYRLHRYYVKGPKAGTFEVFMDNLPGMADNIRRSHTGGYWISFATVRNPDKLFFPDKAASLPWFKKLISKFIPQEVFIKFVQRHGLAIEINEKGEILRSLHDSTGEKVPWISEIEDDNGVLYLGSYNLPYITRYYSKR